MPSKSGFNWEKVGVYTAMVLCFFTVIVYIIEMKVSIAKLEVKVEHLENK